MISCNGKVVLVDFLVFDSRTFSIFLDEELCTISLEKHITGLFTYTFEVDTKVDTPLNRERKKERWKNVVLGIGFIGFVVFLFWGIFAASNWYEQRSIDNLFEAQGYETVASAQLISLPNGKKMYRFAYLFERGKYFTMYKKLPAPNICDNGFPLESGDEFGFLFAISKSTVYRVFYDQPTGGQITRYIERSAASLGKNPAFQQGVNCECIAQEIYRDFGLDGLASLYFHAEDPKKNSNHNRKTFEDLQEKSNFPKLIRNCQN